MAERFKAAVLKTANPQGFVGSNPTLSAAGTFATLRQTPENPPKPLILLRH